MYSQTRSQGYNAFEKDISIVNIYFGDSTTIGSRLGIPGVELLKSFNAEYERRLKMSLVDYISSVGGLFGLFLGFSLLSFLEIVYWLGLFIRNLYRGTKLTADTQY